MPVVIGSPGTDTTIVSPLATDPIALFRPQPYQVFATALSIAQLLFGSPFANPLRVVTAAGNITALPSDGVIVVNKTVGSPTSVTLPLVPVTGAPLTVKDGKGDAAVNNITLLGTIDAQPNLVMNIGYESVTVVWNGAQWNGI